jgi:hypothetical protein
MATPDPQGEYRATIDDDGNVMAPPRSRKPDWMRLHRQAGPLGAPDLCTEPGGELLVVAEAEVEDPRPEGGTYVEHAPWAPLPPMVQKRAAAAATLLADGRVVACGGYNDLGALTDSIEVLNCKFRTPSWKPWTRPPPKKGEAGPPITLPASRYGCCALALPGDLLLVLGGADYDERSLPDADVYDIAAGEWRVLPPMLHARRCFGAALLADGRVLACGGVAMGERLASVELYDPAAGAWAEAAPLSLGPREELGCCTINDGRVLVAGGSANPTRRELAKVDFKGTAPPVGTVRISPLHNDKTRTGDPPLPGTHVAQLQAVLLASALRSAEAFDPATGAWAAISDMRHPRAGLACCSAGGKAFAIGGRGPRCAALWHLAPDGAADHCWFGPWWGVEQGLVACCCRPPRATTPVPLSLAAAPPLPRHARLRLRGPAQARTSGRSFRRSGRHGCMPSVSGAPMLEMKVAPPWAVDSDLKLVPLHASSAKPDLFSSHV